MAKKSGGSKPSAKRITAAIKGGTPRRVAILNEYARAGKLKGYTAAEKHMLAEIEGITGKRIR